MSHPPLAFQISGKHLRWMDRGACNGAADWTLFFADERAKRRGLPAEVPPEIDPYCQACEVRIECLNWALDNDEEGVWGGTTLQQREAMKRPIVRAKCPACQGRSLFRAGMQQVCGECGTSWNATKVHGNASASVDLSPASPNVFRLAKPVYAQPELFDVSPWRAAPCKRKRIRRPRRTPRGEQLVLPGLDAVVTPLRRQPPTTPTAPAVARAVAA
jgi:WhiB family transcriptional regulator, redox-sensing transcriptional regulator